MATTTLQYSSPLYNASSSFYSGVVRISDGQVYGSGALLYDGKTILTAAHVVNDFTELTSSQILFSGINPQQRSVLTGFSYTLYPDYQYKQFVYHDLALIHLNDNAPLFAQRYDVYRDHALGKEFNFSGWGQPGTGQEGLDDSLTQSIRLQAYNQFDADAAQTILNLPELEGTQYVADFDSGLLEHDTLGNRFGVGDLGIGNLEGMIAPGDSGGPAFADEKIAAVASYIYQSNGEESKIGLFGNIGGWTNISYPDYQQWIDQTIRAHYQNAPQYRDEVEKTILEGDEGKISIVYFFLEFHGQRTDENDWLSIDFSTRDGNAIANIDYIPSSGTLVLYPDEASAVIPVEIIGNNLPEPDKHFYLDIYNPVGGQFLGGVEMLSASRTIIDDDGFIG